MDPNGSRSDEQVKMLRGIWNEMKALKASLESQLGKMRQELGARIDETHQRLDAIHQSLEDPRPACRAKMGFWHRRTIESEACLATATTQLTTEGRELSGLIRDWRREQRASR